ncbi:hypothetical protein ACFO6V_21670 [Promicromonospora alba]|uniref:Uncharacterized protein n=1 Tax=Promicromonospora alba TaxID=1616110 RepID=A0ABV9HMQ5_9MICO
MVTSAPTALAEAGTKPGSEPRIEPGTRPVGWVLRAVVSAHLIAIIGQPVFAGVYLTGDFEALSRHAVGADVVTTIGYVQLIVGIVLWVLLRRAWPFCTTLVVVVAETVQYFAGLEGALWLHIPLGVLTVAGLVVQFIAVWLRPLSRRPLAAQPAREQHPEVRDA